MACSSGFFRCWWADPVERIDGIMAESKWYVLHTLSGQEQKVKDSMERRIKIDEMEGLIDEVLIPTEKVSEVKMGKKYICYIILA